MLSCGYPVLLDVLGAIEVQQLGRLRLYAAKGESAGEGAGLHLWNGLTGGLSAGPGVAGLPQEAAVGE